MNRIEWEESEDVKLSDEAHEALKTLYLIERGHAVDREMISDKALKELREVGFIE